MVLNVASQDVTQSERFETILVTENACHRRRLSYNTQFALYLLDRTEGYWTVQHRIRHGKDLLASGAATTTTTATATLLVAIAGVVRNMGRPARMYASIDRHGHGFG